MVDFKLVLSTKNGKSHQQEVKSPEADNLLKNRIGDTIQGDSLGFAGYEFKITGGSDKCGFPMRKGILEARKRILIGESVGFSGKKRKLRKNTNPRTQKGLFKRRTVCGEMVTKIIRQINLQVLKEGAQKLGEAVPEVKEEPKAEAAPKVKEEVKAEAKVEEEQKTPPVETKEDPKEKDQPKEEVNPEEKVEEPAE